MTEATPKGIVLLAMDGGKHSQYALDYYLENLHNKDNQLVITHSMEPIVPKTHYVPREEWMEMVEKEKEKTKLMQKECEEKLQGTNVSWEFKTVSGGQPGEMLCKLAMEVKATLIVIGTRGQGTIRRTILGSVSDYVVHHAHCPVCICCQ